MWRLDMRRTWEDAPPIASRGCLCDTRSAPSNLIECHLWLTGLLISLRTRATGIATGDQAIFVRRSWFEEAGRFPDIPLMEDLALTRQLKQVGRPACIGRPVITSSRRWEDRGFVRTVLLMWRLRLAYYMGADPADLARKYR
jgi:hypothetical protein